MDKVRDLLKKINITGEILRNEPMSLHTSFKVGGPADLYIVPKDREDLVQVVRETAALGISCFFLGAGANILVSDKGIRGAVVDLKELNALSVRETRITVEAGLPVSSMSEAALGHSLSGMEFIYGMPGSVGGSVYMNARCYEHEVSEILAAVRVMDPSGNIRFFPVHTGDFAYKTSPFQSRPLVILEAIFQLSHGTREGILRAMDRNRKDREQKGHFLYPCAGSVFKNNRSFGRPTGQIIDSLGFKGYSIGGAQIADFHGNIIINRNSATADEIKKLIDFVEHEVYRSLEIRLEKELIYIGEWN